MYQDLLVRERWVWKHKRFPASGPGLVLTDHPVCMTSISESGGQVVFVPLDSQTLLLGGSADLLEPMRHATTDHVNFFLAAYANRHIFAADRPTLERVAFLLSDESPFPRERVLVSRQPLFGLPQRIAERMRTASPPPGFDFAADLRARHETFGPSR
jgi:hypothetical protein